MLNVLKAVVDLLIPKSCFCCGREASDALCQKCASSLSLIDDPLCQKCGYPTLYKVGRCRNCRGRRLYFDKARSLLAYEGQAKETLLALKTQSAYFLADFFGRVTSEKLADDFCDVKVATFIPATLTKRLKRGHNVSEVLARALAYHLKLPVVDSLNYRKPVKDQAFLNIDERQKNLKGAFLAKRGIKINGSMLVVDDIYTTGATVNEASRALASVGIRTKVFTVGRTL